MYLDAIVVIALVIASFGWFRRFSKFIYSVAIIDIFLRLINFMIVGFMIVMVKKFKLILLIVNYSHLVMIQSMMMIKGSTIYLPICGKN